MTALQAIKAKCLDCSGGSRKEVQGCTITGCPLHIYRDGHNPARKGIGNRNPNRSGLSRKVAREFGVSEDNTRADRGCADAT